MRPFSVCTGTTSVSASSSLVAGRGDRSCFGTEQRDGEQGNSWFAWGESAHKRADYEWTKMGGDDEKEIARGYTHKQEGSMYKKRRMS